MGLAKEELAAAPCGVQQTGAVIPCQQVGHGSEAAFWSITWTHVWLSPADVLPGPLLNVARASAPQLLQTCAVMLRFLVECRVSRRRVWQHTSQPEQQSFGSDSLRSSRDTGKTVM
jgi:hypothetical protein